MRVGRREDLIAVGGLADDGDAVRAVEHHRQPRAHQGVVVHQQDAGRAGHACHGRRADSRNSPSVAWWSNSPPASRTRSVRPIRPVPLPPMAGPAGPVGWPLTTGFLMSISSPPPGRPSMTTWTGSPGACLRALVSPSWTTRYAVRPAAPGSAPG